MPRRRLFWRIYLFGLLLLVVIAGGVWLMVRWGNNDQARSPLVGLQKFADRAFAQGAEEPADLASIRSFLEAEVALYRADGVLLASDPPLYEPAPLAQEDYEAMRASEQPMRFYSKGFNIAIAVPGGRYLVLRWPAEHSHLWPAFGLAAVLLLSAAVLLPLARSIARPLEKIAGAAQALGQGDLTARVGLQRRDEIGLLARSFDDMAERLQALIRSEKELLANVSHELRTPLARLRVALALVEDDANDPALILQHLSGIQEDVTELQDLVDEVLTAARLALAQGAQPGLPIQRQPLLLRDLVARSAARFAQRHDAALLRVVEDGGSLALKGDVNLLGRLLDNLLENAIKYAAPTPQKPIELRASLIKGAALDEVALEVRDQGPGVEEGVLLRIFEPFFRVDAARSDVPGSGLGLTLCKRIVEAHGGRIWAELAQGGGLRVRVCLPVGEVSNGQTSNPMAANPTHARPE